jgi:L-cysteate sulfo-lyase
VTLTSARERLQTLPFASLVGRSTPIERLERLEKAIDSPYPIFVKRDDTIPFGFGGNKVRKLELVMARALAEGATSVITCGGVQSNHCRATAAAAARLGLSCHLVLSGERPSTLTGNTRLGELFGAEFHFVRDRLGRPQGMAELDTSLRAAGQSPFVIPLGASTSLGAAGFVRALFELLEQGHRPDVIVHSSSSGGTQAGLLAGAVLSGLDARIVGVSADEPSEALARTILGLQEGVFALLEVNARPRSAEVQDQFVGEGYGVPTDASREALTLLARSEAIVVDHTYTAKALAGLIALVRQGSLSAGSSILFWHTGGQVGVLA